MQETAKRAPNIKKITPLKSKNKWPFCKGCNKATLSKMTLSKNGCFAKAMVWENAQKRSLLGPNVKVAET